MEVIKDYEDEELNQLKALDENDWNQFNEDFKKELADYIKKECKPMGELFDSIIDIDLDYYKKINNFVINRIKILNDKIELLTCIDEAFDIVDCEKVSYDDMSDTDIINNKLFIETIKHDELKNSDFYFYLLRENIQLHHVNLFLFIFQNITTDMTEGWYHIIEFLNCGKKKIFDARKKVDRPESLEIQEIDKYWDLNVRCVNNISSDPKQKKIKEIVGTFEKKIDGIIKNEIDLEFILLIFKNSKCLKFIIDHLYLTKKETVFNVVVFSPRFGDNYGYYKDVLENNKKFRDLVLFYIRKKNDWTQIRLFYFFDNQEFSSRLIP